MEESYMDQLNTAYDNYFLNPAAHHTPVLVIDTNTMDFVRRPADLQWVENRIRQTLQLAPFQPELPLSSGTVL